ncbi:flagellar biosynthesis anti-sigma factor FlgM [Nitrospira calida]
MSDQGRANELATVLLGIKETERVSAHRQAETPARRDQVEISETAKELQRIKKLVDQPAPGRAERIEEIRKAIEAGSYEVKGNQVADKIIRNVLTEAVL